MNPYYDNYEQTTLETRIQSQKDGYYTFEDTIFYGEKGGQLADVGTINDFDVLDLKWEGDVLYHKVDAPLENPIHMQVDQRIREINTSVQTLFHLLDGFYQSKGMQVTAVHANPDHQWYEVNQSEVTEALLVETEAFIHQVIREEVPVRFTYQKGSEYDDPFYHQFDTLRLVHIGTYNTQPCGTLHVNHTGQIGSFAILGTEKAKKGHTRILIAVHHVVADCAKQATQLNQTISQLMNTAVDDLPQKIAEWLQAQKQLKKEQKELKKAYFAQRAEVLAAQGDAIVQEEQANRGDLQILAQQMLRQVTQETVVIVGQPPHFQVALVSPKKQARDTFSEWQNQNPQVTGGGSPQIVTAQVQMAQREELVNQLKTLLMADE